jgi:hypothetical protein
MARTKQTARRTPRGSAARPYALDHPLPSGRTIVVPTAVLVDVATYQEMIQARITYQELLWQRHHRWQSVTRNGTEDYLDSLLDEIRVVEQEIDWLQRQIFAAEELSLYEEDAVDA